MSTEYTVTDEMIVAARDAICRRQGSLIAKITKASIRDALVAAHEVSRNGALTEGGVEATCGGCGHAPHHDTECDAEVGYDHLNGSHECGCEGVTVTEWFVRYAPEGPLTERPPYMYEVTEPWTEETARAEVEAQPTRRAAFTRQRTTFPDVVTDWVAAHEAREPRG